MNLTSDGSGPGHGWYCNYVEVTATGVHKQCTQQQFMVEQWLATDAPYELTAIRNYCLSGDDGKFVMYGPDSSMISDL
ncbi:UNVERIFIED_CONTAM: PLAT domain-containing protein 3 [Sesamum latifolium]|uniref:PLAT domain-containing protein 3 n=1 Tax=Sesamum latifolium TaxID=2727402 RepID=A0AAW2Y600_9LAMI